MGLMGLGSLGLVGGATFGGIIGNGERVVAAVMAVELADGAPARVSERYDWEFGALASDKHGIERDVPAPAPTNVVVASPTAPDDVELRTSQRVMNGVAIRIGRADTSINGRHRYFIEYDYARDALVRDDVFSWNAIGSQWPVGFDAVTAVAVSDRAFVDPVCSAGPVGSNGGCEVTQTEPGRLEATVEGLGASEPMTITAQLGEPVTVPSLAVATDPPPVTPGPGLLNPALGVGGASLLAVGATSRFVRRAGRERVSAGGAADAAFAAGIGERLVDSKELAEMATTEFAPPKTLSPAQGGVVHAERVLPHHKAAWLMSEAIEGSVTITGEGKDLMISRVGLPSPSSAPLLGQMFAGRDQLKLGTYDPSFATAWSGLDSALEDWRSNSGGWDPAGERRRVMALVLGGLMAVAGFALVFFVRAAGASVVVSALSALPAAIGVAALIGAWELRVRTSKGSGEWLRVESFRRFLHDSEAKHVEQAYSLGVLREYTAWAVALGEADRWTSAMAAAGNIPDQSAMSMARYAPYIVASAASTSTKPQSSSSGGGGFGGGSSGSGGGGGGGGSW
jgi:hypothetical protein